MGTILTTVAAVIVGGGLATATVFGVVSSQTHGPSQSPVDANSTVVQYGSGQ